MVGDLIACGVIAALIFCVAVRGPKDAPFFRMLWLWLGLSLLLLEVLDLRGDHQWWVKWLLIAGLVALGSVSYARDECGQRTQYIVMWAGLRAQLARRRPFRRQ